MLPLKFALPSIVATPVTVKSPPIVALLTTSASFKVARPEVVNVVNVVLPVTSRVPETTAEFKEAKPLVFNVVNVVAPLTLTAPSKFALLLT